MIQAIIDWFGTGLGQSVLFSAVKILGVFSVLMFIVAYAVWVERKARLPSRIVMAPTASVSLASCSPPRMPSNRS